MKKDMYKPLLRDIQKARQRISSVIAHTPLAQNVSLSEQYAANILLKREDLQRVRSYKIRGAYNKIASLTKSQLSNGVVCASAGNHAQGVAFACNALNIRGTIFMPTPTPSQKVKQVKMFGKNDIEIISAGDTFDDAYAEAVRFCEEHKSTFIHPFNDEKVIEGQATVGLDILNDAAQPIDYLFVPIGGGGLASGVGSVFKAISPDTKIIGVEPVGAASMKASLDAGEVVSLTDIDTFADGVAVRRVGELTFAICREVLDDVVLVPEGKICSTILQLYNESAIVIEPAGGISISALDFYRDKIKGKTVACVVSGSNNDITRMEEIKERSLLYEGMKHYFVIRLPQRAGALREFLDHVLGPSDDITHFEYKKKHSRDKGPIVIGIELRQKEDFEGLIARMKECGIVYEYLNENPDLFQFLL
ncbi:MAG: threonine ammonia-lyase [Prevotellaceae bacterium]|jgi:threonine dehydratase|nr:threonine ammonia-lyase [Prevotellaceae bacterium]